MLSPIRTLAPFPLFVAALLGAFAASPGQSSTLLRWKLKPNDKFHVEMHQNTKQVVSTPGKTMEIPHSMVMQMTWTVEAVDQEDDEEIVRMAQVIDRVTMMMQPPGQSEVTYDSASNEPPTGFAKTLADTLKSMVGVKITQKMNQRGKVIDIHIPEEALSQAKTNPVLKQFFSHDAMKELMGKASPEFPGQPIDPGFRWNTDIQTQSPIGQMNISTTYTYEGKEQRGERELDRIGIAMEMEIAGGGQLGAKVRIIDQDNTGNAYFDAEQGYFAESKVVQKMKLEIEVLGNTMQQSIETTHHLTVTPTVSK